MSCESLFRQMGFHCSEREPGTFRIFSPLRFPDGEPIGWYLKESEGVVMISDNADTLFHLSSVGLDLSDRNKWRGISAITESFGISLEQSGEILGKGTLKAASDLVNRYLGTMLAICDLEREVHENISESSSFVDEVGGHLRLWKPEIRLVMRPSIVGHSGRTHRFDFGFGDELVEAARPHFGRTGSILRKVTDIRNNEARSSVLVVMDDRVDPEKAKYESDILTSVARVLPFTRLTNNLSGAPEWRH